MKGDQVRSTRPLTDWFPIKVKSVKKVLSEVKPIEDIKRPEDLSEEWVTVFEDIPHDGGVDKMLQEVINVLENTYGSPAP